MDERHKTTDKLKKEKCALPLLIINNFSLEASLCSNIHIQVFSVSEAPHITITREGWEGIRYLSTHVDIKLREKRICEIIMSTILKNSLQIQVNET